MVKIALDVMGSDNCPVPDVEGAVLAAQNLKVGLLLVGNQTLIQRELDRHPHQGLKLDIVPAAEAVVMADKPALVGKAKPQSSMHVGMNLVKDGLADGFVTAGNTGAALAIATLHTLGRIPGIKRPALSSIVRLREHRIIWLDIGANADSKPEWLLQYALMGSIYAQNALGLARPRVALLSNGEEEEKGNQLIHDTQPLLKTSHLNYVGNIEPKDMLAGSADVIVSDGFVGNIAVKSFEAFGGLLFDLLRTEIKRTPITLLGGIFARPAFRHAYKQVDPFEIGGAPLLGVNGVVIIGHGRSNALGIKNAIRQAHLAVNGGIVQAIQEGLKGLPS